MTDKSFYFVADAVTGAPIAKANVEFFAYRQKHVDGNNYQVETKDFAEFTDENGETFLPIPDDNKDPTAREFQWLAIATTKAGRLAYIGFHNVWRTDYYDAQYNEIKTFAITDRPVYRPEPNGAVQVLGPPRPVRCRRQIRIRAPIVSPSRFTIPKAEKSLRRNAHVRQLRRHRRQVRPARATPRSASTNSPSSTAAAARSASRNTRSPSSKSRSTRPTEPVMLGEKITATIQAKYYFGSPVTNATVKYKVMRSEHTAPGIRPDRGTGSTAPATGGSPTTTTGIPAGAIGAAGGRRRGGSGVSRRRRKSSPNAKCRSAPTARSKSRSTRRSPRNCIPTRTTATTITAEVVDQSRRTIVGNGEVLVARKPFQVFAWVDRGYYRVGDTINAQLRRPPARWQTRRRRRQAETAQDHATTKRPKPIETEVKNWSLATNAEGQSPKFN